MSPTGPTGGAGAAGEGDGTGEGAPGGRLTIVVNRRASAVSTRRIGEVREALGARHDVEMAETTQRGHATELAAEAAARGVGTVVVLGGDGTLSEAANGLVGTSTALAALPGGSTNVFARTIGMPNDVAAACRTLLDALASGSVRRVGLGQANGRWFLFHVGMGFDAAVVHQVEQRAGLKRLIGQAAFVLGGVSAWARHGRERPLLRVELEGDDDGPPGDPAHLVICLKTNPYTYLGARPFDIAPEAGLDRGLAVVSLHTLALLPLLSAIGSAVGVGRPIREHAGVRYSYDLRRVVVRGDAAFPWQVDGDYRGTTDEVVLHHEPACLRVVVP